MTDRTAPAGARPVADLTDRERLARALDRMAAAQEETNRRAAAAASKPETVTHADLYQAIGGLTAEIRAHREQAAERHGVVLDRFEKGSRRMDAIEAKVDAVDERLDAHIAEHCRARERAEGRAEAAAERARRRERFLVGAGLIAREVGALVIGSRVTGVLAALAALVGFGALLYALAGDDQPHAVPQHRLGDILASPPEP